MSHIRVGDRLQFIWRGWLSWSWVWKLPFPRPATLRRTGMRPIFWHYCVGPVEMRLWREPMPPRD